MHIEGQVYPVRQGRRQNDGSAYTQVAVVDDTGCRVEVYLDEFHDFVPYERIHVQLTVKSARGASYYLNCQDWYRMTADVDALRAALARAEGGNGHQVADEVGSDAPMEAIDV